MNLILLVQILALTEPHTTVAYFGTYFYTPISSIGFSLFVTSSLACDAVLVSNDYTSIHPADDCQRYTDASSCTEASGRQLSGILCFSSRALHTLQI
jgi:hypothetical protein